MSLKTARPSVRQFLYTPTVLDQLRQAFQSIQAGLTTTIREAATLTHLTEAQLRYAETRSLLEPSRADLTDVDGGRGQRRYTANDLIRGYLIAYLLEHGYSLREIREFMEEDPDSLQNLRQPDAVRLKTAIGGIETLQFSRFTVPRLLYYATSLLFERDAVANAGLIIPVHADNTKLSRPESQTPAPPPALEDETPIQTPDDLEQLGRLLIAWRSAGSPLLTIVTSGNPFEREQQPLLTPLLQLLPEDLPDPLAASAASIFIACEPSVMRELHEADHTFTIRRTRNPGGANARMVALRLIIEAQRITNARLALADDERLERAKAQIFAAPEMVNPALGDALLNQLSNTIVRLGGATCDDEGAARSRWRFSCVLTPRDLQARTKEQELVVRAQSRNGPHRIDVTNTSPTRNGGLTYRAYSSGRIAFRKEISPLDPAVSYLDVEQPIKSAIAVPTVESPGAERGQPPAVIYVASEAPDAFQADDLLLLRVLGRLVGEIVLTYNSRGHREAALTDALVNPEIVDNFFAEFDSDTDFTNDLTSVFQQVSRHPAEVSGAGDEVDTSHLTLVGFDINDFVGIQHTRGIELARLVAREIGLRAKRRLETSFPRRADQLHVYHVWGDRYYALVRDEDLDVASRRLERIHTDLSGMYAPTGETLMRRGPIPPPDAGAATDAAGIRVGVRMVGMTLTWQDLGAQFFVENGERVEADDVARSIARCVATLTRRLDDGLKQASELPDSDRRMLWWNDAQHHFDAPSAEERASELG